MRRGQPGKISRKSGTRKIGFRFRAKKNIYMKESDNKLEIM